MTEVIQLQSEGVRVVSPTLVASVNFNVFSGWTTGLESEVKYLGVLGSVG